MKQEQAEPFPMSSQLPMLLRHHAGVQSPARTPESHDLGFVPVSLYRDKKAGPKAENLPIPDPASRDGGSAREQANSFIPAPSLLLSLPPAPSAGHVALGLFMTHRVSWVVGDGGVCVRDWKPAFLMRSLSLGLSKQQECLGMVFVCETATPCLVTPEPARLPPNSDLPKVFSLQSCGCRCLLLASELEASFLPRPQGCGRAGGPLGQPTW